MKHKVEFTSGESIEVAAGEILSDCMDITDSPILFGCRTGVCATCIVKVHAGMENLPPVTRDETEVIEIHTKEPNCRLACQLTVKGDVKLEYIGK